MTTHHSTQTCARLLTTAAMLLLAGSFQQASAKLTPNQIFSENMVLQRDVPTQIWGKGDPGETITIKINTTEAEATVAQDGTWRTELPALAAGGPYELNLNSDDDALNIKNILIGDVWLCSGQSNMGWTLIKSLNGSQEVAAVNNPTIRLFDTARIASETPLDDVNGQWLPANKYSVKDFSAVAWYFGQALQAEIDVPIGLVLSEVGGTLANNWTSEPTLDGHPNIQAYRKRYIGMAAEYPALVAKWAIERQTNPKATKPKDPAYRQPSGYFNGMIAPLQPLTLKGVIWYQGESDSWKWQDYTQFFQDLIVDWRSGFESPELPFLYVMLAGYNGKVGVDENYPHIRDIQLKTLELPHTAMALALDVGEADNIHPLNKKPVGERLALAAMGTVYGKDICYSGPIMREVSFEASHAIVHYDHIGDGLTSRDETLRAFELAGKDRQYFAATAEIEGDTVRLSSPQVPSPAYARYAWSGFPNSNLYNANGLPATPFRTDTED